MAGGVHPRMISSWRSCRPFSISVTSTFFLHAFLPFLDGWLFCFGSLMDPLESPQTTGMSLENGGGCDWKRMHDQEVILDALINQIFSGDKSRV